MISVLISAKLLLLLLLLTINYLYDMISDIRYQPFRGIKASFLKIKKGDITSDINEG